jgi:hypothetical protein
VKSFLYLTLVLLSVAIFAGQPKPNLIVATLDRSTASSLFGGDDGAWTGWLAICVPIPDCYSSVCGNIPIASCNGSKEVRAIENTNAASCLPSSAFWDCYFEHGANGACAELTGTCTVVEIAPNVFVCGTSPAAGPVSAPQWCWYACL